MWMWYFNLWFLFTCSVVVTKLKSFDPSLWRAKNDYKGPTLINNNISVTIVAFIFRFSNMVTIPSAVLFLLSTSTIPPCIVLLYWEWDCMSQHFQTSRIWNYDDYYLLWYYVHCKCTCGLDYAAELVGTKLDRVISGSTMPLIWLFMSSVNSSMQCSFVTFSQ